MISRAIKAGVPFAWFTADEAYGQAKWLQAWLEDHDISYVMAIRCRDTVTTGAGEQRADVLIAALSPQCWQRISAGAGAHGRREHRWARIPVRSRWRRGRGHWLLARRSSYVKTLAERSCLTCGAESRPGCLGRHRVV